MIDKRDVVTLRVEAIEALLQYMLENDMDLITVDRTRFEHAINAYESDQWPDEHEVN